MDEVLCKVQLGPEGQKLPLEKLKPELYKPLLGPAQVPMGKEWYLGKRAGRLNAMASRFYSWSLP